MSEVWEESPDVDDRSGIPALSALRCGSFGYGGNCVRADTDLVENMVCRHVVCDPSERRGECFGAETRSWLWELSNSLDVVA